MLIFPDISHHLFGLLIHRFQAAIHKRIFISRNFPKSRQLPVIRKDRIRIFLLGFHINLLVIRIDRKPRCSFCKSGLFATAPLHRGSGIVPAQPVAGSKCLLLIKPCCERLCILILRTDIIELLDRGSPDISHTDFLPLINKRNSPEQNTDSSQHLDSGIILRIIRQEHADTSRLIMIFNNIGIPSEGFHLRLGSKKGTSPCLKIHRLRFIPSMFPQTK